MPPTSSGGYELLEQLRWGGAPTVCPTCGAGGRCHFLAPRGGARATRTGAPTDRRVWKCGACRAQFSALAATILQGTRLDLVAWIGVLDLFVTGSAPTLDDVMRRYRLSRPAARHMVCRAAAAVPHASAGRPLGGLLELSPALAARIRAATPSRVRPRRQRGPSADYGAG